MSIGSRFMSWTNAVLRRSRLENEMEAELRFHIDSRVADLMRGGMSREKATRQTRLEFGNPEVHKDDCRSSLGLRLGDELGADLRYGVRMLRKSPAFTAVAILSLALGIGANSAIFTLANGVLLERLNVPHPDQLRLLSWVSGPKLAMRHLWGDTSKNATGQYTSTSFSYPVYQQLRVKSHSFDNLFAFKDISRFTVTVDGNAEVTPGEMVSGNFYQGMAIAPIAGRPILPSDDAAPGSGPVAVISDAFWAQHFGRSPAAIGQTIQLNRIPVTIIGVNPPSFLGAQVGGSAQIFVPLSMQPQLIPRPKGTLLENADYWWLQIMGRLKPDVSAGKAQSELEVAFDSAVKSMLLVNKDASLPQLTVIDGSRGLDHLRRDFAKPIYVLAALAGLVLLVACANLANLLLARSAARQREMSVRLALGAGRMRIIRQVVTESMLLASLGCGAGLALGYAGRNIIPNLVATSWQPNLLRLKFNWQVLVFTIAVSLLTGLLFGIAPAWQATNAGVNAGLKEATRVMSARRKGLAGKMIVVLQISLSALLVIGSGLFLRTLSNLYSTQIGFRPENILLFDIDPPSTRYSAGLGVAVHRRIEQTIAATPGVESVTLTSDPLIANDSSIDTFAPTGRTPHAGQDTSAWSNRVGVRFFETMGIPILYGRGFDEQVTATSPKVAVVNQRLAQQFFPGENAIGMTFDGGDKSSPIEIVGVCANTKYENLRSEPPPTFYLPYVQHEDPGSMTYEVKTAVPGEDVVNPIREAVQTVDKDLPLIDVRTQVAQIDATTTQERIFAVLTTSFGGLALVLACIGIYGIMAYTVAMRTNEIGIRMALGAQVRSVVLMVLGETTWLVGIGLVLGISSAVGLTRLVRSMLFGLGPTDPVTFIGASLLLLAVALLAGWGPARKASLINPVIALRHE
jgi:predicted permease